MIGDLALLYIVIFFAYETSTAEVKFSDQELRNRLTPLQYHVTQEKGTERYFAESYGIFPTRNIFSFTEHSLVNWLIIRRQVCTVVLFVEKDSSSKHHDLLVIQFVFEWNTQIFVFPTVKVWSQIWLRIWMAFILWSYELRCCWNTYRLEPWNEKSRSYM